MIPEDYPRPQYYRNTWRTLNGTWEFDFYDDEFLLTLGEKLDQGLGRKITVPFSYQAPASGIGVQDCHPKVIYRRKIRFSGEEQEKLKVLHFNAVDYRAQVWADDIYLGCHEGGYAPFSFDITEAAANKPEVTLVVLAEDPPSLEQPRGKQAADSPFACWYTPTTGFWRPVWLEFLPPRHLASYTLETSPLEGRARCDVVLSRPIDQAEIQTEVFLAGEPILTQRSRARFPSTPIPLEIPNPQLWGPETPNLYEVRFTLTDKAGPIDQTETYLALRDLEMGKDGLSLNGSPLYQKLVLFQGYWEDGGYTAPDSKAFERDILQAKEMGFNGARMHEKWEDPRFLAAADRLGFLLWGEAPSFYQWTNTSRTRFTEEWIDLIYRDKTHPSIIAWVVCNESWGIREIGGSAGTGESSGKETSADIKNWLEEMYQLTRRIDPTRPIIINDGWEHYGSDILTLHSYHHHPRKLKADWHQAQQNQPCGILNKEFDLKPAAGKDRPLLLSEFGGISYLDSPERVEHWGYEEEVRDQEEFAALLTQIFNTVYSFDRNTGYCYTQFADVGVERNGLVHANRRPKINPAVIKSIIDGIQGSSR